MKNRSINQIIVAMLACIVFIVSVTVSYAEISRIGNWTTGLTHTPGAGNYRLLVFVTSMENVGDRDITNVTYGGQTMNQEVEDSDFAGANYSRCEIWVLTESGIQAATGNTFVVTYSGTPSSFSTAHAAATFQNVAQSVSILDTASNTSKDQATISTPSFTVTRGGMGVSGAVHGSGGSYDDNGWGTGWTEGTDQAPGGGMTLGSSNKTVAYIADGTDTATATHSPATNRHVIVAASLNPLTLPIVKQVWEEGGTAPLGNPTAPVGATLVFLIYIKNTNASAVTDLRINDNLDEAGFEYVAGSLRRTSDAVPPADTDSDLIIFNKSGDGTSIVLSDAVDVVPATEVASAQDTAGPAGVDKITIGAVATQTNASLSIGANETFALRFKVKVK